MGGGVILASLFLYWSLEVIGHCPAPDAIGRRFAGSCCCNFWRILLSDFLVVEQNSSGAINPLFSRLRGRTKPYFFKNRFYKGKNEIFLKVKVVGNSVFTGVRRRTK